MQQKVIEKPLNIRTCATEALFAQPQQHVQAQIAVGGSTKVLKSPHMDSVLLQCVVHPQQHQQRNGGHSSPLPLLQ